VTLRITLQVYLIITTLHYGRLRYVMVPENTTISADKNAINKIKK